MVLRVFKNQPYCGVNVPYGDIEFVIIVQIWLELVMDHYFGARNLKLVVLRKQFLLIGCLLVDGIHQSVFWLELLLWCFWLV